MRLMPNLKIKNKLDLSLFPGVALAHAVFALMDGAQKYEPYNYRDTEVNAREYISATKRHLDAWLEREECADDSKAHHLGHAIASLAILLDAQATGNLIDDRPKRNALAKTMIELNKLIKGKHANKI